MERSRAGLGCLEVFGLVFIVLKLVGVIEWSWIWVLAPFWGQIVLIVIGAILLWLAKGAEL